MCRSPFLVFFGGASILNGNAADGGTITSANPTMSVDVVKLRWPDKTPPAGQPNAHLFEDALATAGRSWADQPITYAIPAGQSIPVSAINGILAAMNSNNLSAYDAAIAVGYEIMGDLGGEINVYYKVT